MVAARHFHGRLERDRVARFRSADRGADGKGPAMTGWKPGDPRPDAASMLRVDQAGEYGATRIYAGQLAVLGQNRPATRVIARMARQEEQHLRRFNAMMAERRVRPRA